jgi:hypothetical protein
VVLEVQLAAAAARCCADTLPALCCLDRLQDFYNLVDVYLDAVLHPKCVSDKRTFEQVRQHCCVRH